MTQDEITDEMLMAYADDALDAEACARIEARLAGDAALASRLAVFTGTRDALGGLARRDLAEVQLPPGLQASLTARIAAAGTEATEPQRDKVLVFAPREGQRVPLWSGALAASLALAIGLGGGLMLGQRDVGEHLPPVAALDTLPSGAQETLADGTAVRIISSFVSVEGAICREYEITHTSGLHAVEVACDAGSGWEVQLMLALEGSEGYMPASAPELLDTYYMQSDAGAPLSPEEERAALDARVR
jgi:hypothetical protein